MRLVPVVKKNIPTPPIAGCIGMRLEWSCRDSNPGPNKTAERFLHAYSGIICRENTGTGHTDVFLS